MPPIFTYTEKFDGTNWVTWRVLIRLAAEMNGVFGYLDGSIKNPGAPIQTTAFLTTTQSTTSATTPTSTTATSPAPQTATTGLNSTLSPTITTWDSPTPSAAEWKIRNAWSKASLIFNTKNPIGLGINISGSAADAWDSYISEYEAASDWQGVPPNEN